MILNTQHRAALLNELETAQKDLEQQEHILDNPDKAEAADLIEWFDMSRYLAIERIKVIKAAITTNEIDY